VQYNEALSQTKDPWTNVGFNINLQQKLDTSGQEITADADYLFYRTKGRQYSNNYLYNADGTLLGGAYNNPNPYLLNGYLPADIDIFSIKSDYQTSFKKNATFEAGFKVSYVKTDNDAQYTLYNNDSKLWQRDDARSNHFLYKENINAAYVNLQKQFKKFGVQLGLRAEQTIADGEQTAQNVAPFHLNYTKLFPTSYISYKINDTNTLALSYGRRIERPGYQQLNPFQYQLDRYTYQQGNPTLQPQFSHNIEFSYNYKGQFNVAINYTTTKNIINDVLKNVKLNGDSNYTTFQTTENIASNTNIGISISYNKQIRKWWTLNAFANVYNNKYEGVIDGENINLSLTSLNTNVSSHLI
jgi:outer membrane receptor protein involved in Fe transport